MKTLLTLIFATLPFTANASTLDCVATGLAYSHDKSDGGAYRNPRTQLVLQGKLLVDAGHLDPKDDVVLGQFELVGKAQLLKKRKVGNYVTTHFESKAQVTTTGDNGGIAFEGDVLCKSVQYVGPPLP